VGIRSVPGQLQASWTASSFSRLTNRKKPRYPLERMVGDIQSQFYT